jgi:uncharacterized protein (TIGR02118 family)
MFKAMILLTRRDDMTTEAFRKWWLDEHAPLAQQLDGVRKIVFNVVADGSTGVDGVDGVDGIAELWFDSRAAFEAAYATEYGTSVAADSIAHVSKRVRLVVDEVSVLG